MAARILYLIRNGQYDRDTRSLEEAGGPLTEAGRDQAGRTALALRDLPIRAIYCSPYRQSQETAAFFAEALPQALLEESNLLRQYDTMQDVDSTFHPDILARALAFKKRHLARAYEHFFLLPDEDANLHEVIVCHANIIRDLICRAIGVQPETWAHMIINHCGISCMRITAEAAPELVVYNDVSHLPDSLRTDI